MLCKERRTQHRKGADVIAACGAQRADRSPDLSRSGGCDQSPCCVQDCLWVPCWLLSRSTSCSTCTSLATLALEGPSAYTPTSRSLKRTRIGTPIRVRTFWIAQLLSVGSISACLQAHHAGHLPALAEESGGDSARRSEAADNEGTLSFSILHLPRAHVCFYCHLAVSKANDARITSALTAMHDKRPVIMQNHVAACTPGQAGLCMGQALKLLGPAGRHAAAHAHQGGGSWG